MTDRVVLKDGRAGRLVETTARGMRVQFVGPDRYETETVRDADVSDVQYAWPMYVSPLEESAAQIYVAKARSPRQMDAGWWERIVHQFPSSARHCLHLAELLEGDPDADV
jgi:hypothetical protein